MSKKDFTNGGKAATWSSEEFLNQLAPLRERLKRHDLNAYYGICDLRVLEYQNTIAMVNQGYYLTESGTEVKIESEAMEQGSRFYSDPFTVDHIAPIGTTEVTVVNVECLAEAMRLIDEGYNPAVLNLANRHYPGGGVENGAGAQEEGLFRRTNLFRSLYQYSPYCAKRYGMKCSVNQYPMDRNFGGIYTPGATLFREGEGKGYKLMDEPYHVSFIAVAGINGPELDENGMIASHLVETVKNKIRTILRIGLDNGHDSLVLGALGCGAFRNPPRHVARLFHEVIDEKEFAGKYRLLTFAIIDSRHSTLNGEGNFKPFAEEFM